MFKYADPSKLGRSLLEGNKDHLLSQARSELVKQEHQVESLNSCTWYHGIRTTLAQHCIAECRLNLRAVNLQKR